MHGDRFFVVEGGKRMFTPVSLAVIFGVLVLSMLLSLVVSRRNNIQS